MLASRQEGQRAKRCRGQYHFAKRPKLPAELLRINAQAPEPSILRYAAEFLARGRVLGIPTDTVYGLAADPFNLSAVEEIYRVKGRPETRALPILVNSIDQALLLARDVPENFLRLAHEFWPGALTLVVDAGHRLPLKVTANTGRVALRLPRSSVVATLIDEFGVPTRGSCASRCGSREAQRRRPRGACAARPRLARRSTATPRRASSSSAAPAGSSARAATSGSSRTSRATRRRGARLERGPRPRLQHRQLLASRSSRRSTAPPSAPGSPSALLADISRRRTDRRGSSTATRGSASPPATTR